MYVIQEEMRAVRGGGTLADVWYAEDVCVIGIRREEQV